MTANLITRAAAPTLLRPSAVLASPHLQPLPLRYPNREPIDIC